MTSAHKAYVAFGSNTNNRRRYIQKALKKLNQLTDTNVNETSCIYETRPLGEADQPDFLNSVAEVQTTLTPVKFYQKLSTIEKSLGRTRKTKWQPRKIDLDLLLFDNRVLNSASLTVPHPQMHLRSFVLDGLCQINPGLVHPLIGLSAEKLRDRLQKGNFYLDKSRPQLISIAGPIGVGKTTLAKKLAGGLDAEKILEMYDKNPFLPRVYAGNSDLALESQMFFLTSRLNQLNTDVLKPGQLYITDYVFQKELVYAKMLLSSEQFKLYQPVYEHLCKCVAEPVLLIYLDDTADNCRQKIQKRNRRYEQNISVDFLSRVKNGYKRMIAGWGKCPVFKIDVSNTDLRKSENLKNLTRQIRYYIA